MNQRYGFPEFTVINFGPKGDTNSKVPLYIYLSICMFICAKLFVKTAIHPALIFLHVKIFSCWLG